MPLPRDFLIEMARRYALSPEQEDAFVIGFSSNKTELEIATELHITNSALTTRMSHVYKKFSINGKGPGKYGRLLNFLTAEYRKSRASASPTSNLSEDELNNLVEEVRQKWCEMIQDQYGTMRALTMSQPIDVSELYTNVNILTKIQSYQWGEIDELRQNFNPENFDRFGLGKPTDKRISGLEAVEKYSKLMVLGKPGAGKTTFLRHLAIQCNQGIFQADRVPILVELKRFAEAEGKPSLLKYITDIFLNCDVYAEKIAVILKRGKTLVLLDGLDEVKLEDNSRIIKQVRDFSDQFYRNQFLITCRIAANHYNFDKFTDVEIADFDWEQIRIFVEKWFKANKADNAKELIEQLENNNRIRELATNPLLLTLLCLVFYKSHKFPDNRSELYEEGVDILLKEWDETREIEREQVYRNLSWRCKKDLLSQIALTTFERGDYFFKQKELEQYISEYIRSLPDAKNDPEALQFDSEAVLKSIEAQHGLLVERAHKIYSFSHLTFQEYFAASKIVENSGLNSLQHLVSHITDKRWREVFLLVAEMLKNADELLMLMRKEIYKLVSFDDKLQQFLIWVNQKTLLVQSLFKPEAIRSFYFNLGLAPVNSLDAYYAYDTLALLSEVDDFDANSENELSLTGNLPDELNIDLWLMLNFKPTLNFRLFNYPLGQSLQRLTEQIPNLNQKDEWEYENDEWWEEDENVEWWQANCQAWTEQLRSVLIEHRNIGHRWEFCNEQKESLQNYYDANKLLIDCLNSSCNVSPEVREEIEETLLLPKDEIEKWKQRRTST
ncbi:NACHT domain-containing NTPase [Limnoraphis robusta Tam1]|uniref:NACHT domain-containing protein n=1 Tax=Limnoraphis robusta TaxID=1118279 RepID=UPI002B1FEF11|nr:NACHT domain-containing NTPase [Limnoraphis robusta]MEA5498366.1 NACHT domain-containing NTPase [Limnoraphis robusta BA-68 BA1]MEA5540390.1 NACHT domain-containing NTPase [Limnoraphis robusta Tam1]